MTATERPAAEIGLPRFAVNPAPDAQVFDLDSHARARAALDFGLSVDGLGFNIFLVGEDRAARMTATLAYLNAAVAKLPATSDWIYLNNFRHPDRPTPHALPAGMGRKFRDATAALIPRLREALAASFAADAYRARVLALRDEAEKEVARDADELVQAARAHGLQLVQGQDGALRLLRSEHAPDEASASVDPQTERALAVALSRVQLRAVAARAQLASQVQELNRGVAGEIISPAVEALLREFSGFGGLARWLTELRVDMIETPERFQLAPGAGNDAELPELRYSVNLFVDRGEESHPLVVLENNPNYENLFGWIEYRQAQGSVQTDFTQLRAGAIHHANGGVLVLRAEALAANPASWTYLKAALRDRQIVIEELQRKDKPPVAGTPRPDPIPLALKVVVVGSPHWYRSFFEGDSDFRTYFKVTAEIDTDGVVDQRNLDVYAGLIAGMAQRQGASGIAPEATARLLGIAARWAERRDRLTARVELIEDLVAEATTLGRRARQKLISDELVAAAYEERRHRNARFEERMLQTMVEGMMMIDTAGKAIGRVNALTVNTATDHRFGTPVRVTARSFAGRAGVVNIERATGMSGPIQQKGAMVLEGYLAGRFAQTRPLSFACSITFEQVYGGVEGDSASMAELLAVLSELAQLPVRQDIAITGSVNQEGHAQAIGGAHWKVEGFHRLCTAKPGGLTGTQGVIVPQANCVNLVVQDDVAADVAAGRFHLWSVATVEDVAELMLGFPAGTCDESGGYPPHTIFGRVAARLDAFDRILAARDRASG
ncbi:MAG TPA: ATP-binding protein [Stellaceae bacterium]|nr:ATP-binding protein [Stellaceae bacterium]